MKRKRIRSNKGERKKRKLDIEDGMILKMIDKEMKKMNVKEEDIPVIKEKLVKSVYTFCSATLDVIAASWATPDYCSEKFRDKDEKEQVQLVIDKAIKRRAEYTITEKDICAALCTQRLVNIHE